MHCHIRNKLFGLVVWSVAVSAVEVSLDWVVQVAVLSLCFPPHDAIALDEMKTPTIANITALSIAMSFAKINSL